MASSDLPSKDDFEIVDAGGESDGETEWLELDAGEHIIAEVRDIRPNCGEHGTTVLELARGIGDVVVMWSNNQIDRAFNEYDVGTGDVVLIEHTEETRTFTDDDTGEEREYDIWNVGLPTGGDD